MAHPVTVAVIVAGVFTALATIISFHLCYKHLTHYTKPHYQKYIVRIILMVPVYSIESWVSLFALEWSLWFDAVRDTYEAYVLYTFTFLLIEFLNNPVRQGQDKRLHLLEQRSNYIRHPWPFTTVFRPFQPNRNGITQIKRGVLQFVLVKPLTSIIALYLDSYNLYSEGHFDFTKGYPYVTFINTISASVSLYCLVLFYMATKEALEGFNPLAKFLCVKSVIFFSFWQGVGIAILVRIGVISDIKDYPAQDLAVGLQDSCICFEMFIASIVHIFAFGYKEFQEGQNRAVPLLRNLREVVDFREVLSDARETFLSQDTEVELDEKTPILSQQRSRTDSHDDPYQRPSYS